MKDLLSKIATETVEKARKAQPMSNASIELCFKYFWGKSEDGKHYATNSNFFYFCESGLLVALVRSHHNNNINGLRN